MAFALKILLILSAIYLSYFNINNIYLKMLKDEISINERIELEQFVIKRINKEYYDYKNKNFDLELFDTAINVEYNDLEATITAKGKHNFISFLIYNDEYGTIEDYYYIENK